MRTEKTGKIIGKITAKTATKTTVMLFTALLMSGCSSYIGSAGAGQTTDASQQISSKQQSSEPQVAEQTSPETSETAQTQEITTLPAQGGQPVQTGQNPEQSAGQTGEITEQQALEIALSKAGLTEEDIRYLYIKRDWDDHRFVYDVEFMAAGIEYDFEILAADGQILGMDYDADHAAEWNAAGGAGGKGTGPLITQDEAKNTIAERIPGIDTASIYLEPDYEDGRWIYEGEAYYKETEYEFEIDGTSGQVIKWEQESIRKNINEKDRRYIS